MSVRATPHRKDVVVNPALVGEMPCPPSPCTAVPGWGTYEPAGVSIGRDDYCTADTLQADSEVGLCDLSFVIVVPTCSRALARVEASDNHEAELVAS